MVSGNALVFPAHYAKIVQRYFVGSDVDNCHVWMMELSYVLWTFQQMFCSDPSLYIPLHNPPYHYLYL